MVDGWQIKTRVTLTDIGDEEHYMSLGINTD